MMAITLKPAEAHLREVLIGLAAEADSSDPSAGAELRRPGCGSRPRWIARLEARPPQVQQADYCALPCQQLRGGARPPDDRGVRRQCR